MLQLSNILDIVSSYHPQPDLDLIRKAYVFSAKHHAGQTRKNGEPYLTHPLEVAKILAELKLDEASICTGLLHDTVEDTQATKQDIEDLFGKDIAELVDGVTKLSQIKFYSTEEKQAENFRKMLVAISKDIRVLLVKLADRLHNMRTLQYMNTEKQEQIALETMEIYAPLANRLGMGWLKVELEDLSFRYIKPWDYCNLKEKIGKTKKEREHFINEVSKELQKTLSNITNCDVSGRPKHLWSIYRKMKDKALAFDDIYDLIAFRVLVQNISQCYEALGLIHAKWRPIPGRFKDYIAMPKPNGYSSLHTTLIGPKGERIEIQIRTKNMHEIAESGIAAHWKYKEQGSLSFVFMESAVDKGFSWLKQLMNWQKDLKDPNEFLDSVKVDLFSEEVYVFTPKGDVIELPRGATPIDLAFAVHSDVGMQCIGAKVNNRIVPLKYVLENGDTCEIITQKNQMPKKDWLDFVKTSKAKNKIRAVMKQLERERSKEIGKELLEKEFRRYHTTLTKEIKNNAINNFIKDKKVASIEELYILLGYGKIDPKQVIEYCLPNASKLEPVLENKKSRLSQLFEKIAKRTQSGIKVDGINNVLLHYARCCAPVKGDPIIGFVTRGRGISIHRRDCQKIMELDSERRIAVTWIDETQTLRPIAIKIYSEDREGMLTDLSAVFLKLGINISEAKCKVLNNNKAVNTFKCSVFDLEQLKLLIRQLSLVQGVNKVERSQSE